jgi:TatA/E family protein of Tat protein translocase
MEILVILVAGLLILGPKRLPEAARQMGKALAELRRVTSGFQNEMRDTFEGAISVDPDPAPPAPPVPPAVPPAPATPADAELHVDDGQPPKRDDGQAPKS